MSPIRALRHIKPPTPVIYEFPCADVHVLGTFGKGDVLTVQKVEDMIARDFNDRVFKGYKEVQGEFIRAMVTSTYDSILRANLINPPNRFTRWNREHRKRAPSLVIGRAS